MHEGMSRAQAEEALAEGREPSPRELLALWRSGRLDTPPITGAPYAAWRALCEAPADALLDSRLAQFFSDPLPLISVLMPVYNPVPDFLDQAIASVRGQSYPAWELCIADDASTDAAVSACLQRHAAEDGRIRLLRRSANGHISAATNSALEMAQGTWCAFMDHDDLLHRHALTRIFLASGEESQASFLFSDEDRVDESGRRSSPHFKPGFNPDLLLACNCVCHLGVCRTDMLRSLGGLREGVEGAQDHDLALRVLAELGSGAFAHVPHVLYHWRMHADSTSAGLAAKPYAVQAALRAKTEFFASRAVPAQAEFLPHNSVSQVRFALPARPPLLSLILCVPGDGPDAVRWIRDLAGRTAYAKREMLIAPHGTPSSALARLDGEVLPAQATPAAARNAAAQAARGAVLLFVDAFSLPLAPDWAEALIAAVLWAELGAVGNRRLQANGFLAHAGYAPGQNAFFPAFAGLHPQSGGYFSQAHLPRSVAVLSVSCLCLRTSVFMESGGFDENLQELAAADLCLRLHARGLRCLCTPLADMAGPREAALPYTPAFTGRWPGLPDAAPYQNPHLDWTPGGWKLRLPEALSQAAYA
ncbi:MAG: glycosyltransferase [Deltaproteobacteria bacterium]|jgi:GT2 family glycosyltransferase|nr:glycosyltransferase [Deltaproteobacteria bacterium]